MLSPGEQKRRGYLLRNHQKVNQRVDPKTRGFRERERESRQKRDERESEGEREREGAREREREEREADRDGESGRDKERDRDCKKKTETEEQENDRDKRGREREQEKDRQRKRKRSRRRKQRRKSKRKGLERERKRQTAKQKEKEQDKGEEKRAAKDSQVQLASWRWPKDKGSPKRLIPKTGLGLRPKNGHVNLPESEQDPILGANRSKVSPPGLSELQPSSSEGVHLRATRVRFCFANVFWSQNRAIGCSDRQITKT